MSDRRQIDGQLAYLDATTTDLPVQTPPLSLPAASGTTATVPVRPLSSFGLLESAAMTASPVAMTTAITTTSTRGVAVAVTTASSIRGISPRRAASAQRVRRALAPSVFSCCLVLTTITLLQQWSMQREFYDWYSLPYMSLLMLDNTTTTAPLQESSTGNGAKVTPAKGNGSRERLSEIIRQRQAERVEEMLAEVKNRNWRPSAEKRERTQSREAWQRELDRQRSEAAAIKNEEEEDTPERFLFDYNQPTNRTAQTLPEPIVKYANHTLAVVVLSARDHADRRTVIRETWGRGHALYFAIGGAKEPKLDAAVQKALLAEQAAVQKALLAEQKRHGDLLDSIHPDSYEGLPHKLKFAYRWIVRNTNASWILKTDDDTVARVDSLERHLLTLFNPSLGMVVGNIIPSSAVARSGKWAELPSYNRTKYPYWPQGSCGHVVSRPVAAFVGDHLEQLPNYQGEDTSLGIWLDESKLPLTWVSSRYFVNHGRCSEMDWLVIGHQISVERMRKCFEEKGDEWDEARLHDKASNLLRIETLKQRQSPHRTQWY